ncbi:MAG: Lon-like protease helical domain-containing protein, partial [Candidatus Binatia bacterium]
MSTATNEPQEPRAIQQPTAATIELSAEQLRFRAPFTVDFRTTEELGPPGHDFVGQERARAALELGLGIASSGFNILVSGLTGTEKLEALRGWVAQRAAQAPTSGDWVYVHNFAYPDAPRAISLAPGQGARLKRFMTELVKT